MQVCVGVGDVSFVLLLKFFYLYQEISCCPPSRLVGEAYLGI